MADSTPLNLVLESPVNEPGVISKRLFHILNTYIQPNATLSPANAAQEIDKLFPLNRPKDEGSHGRKNEEPGSFLWKMWRIVISVAQQIPWRHPGQTRLIELIQALEDLPEPMMVEIGSWGEQAIWSDLPILGPVMTECGHGMRLGFIFS